MKKLLFGVLVVPASLGAAGCGGDEPSSGAGGASASSSVVASTSSSAVSSTSSAVATSATGTMIDDTCETANPMAVGTAIDGDLDPTGDVDYYFFDGTAGEPWSFDIDAEVLEGTAFDDKHIDSVVTLFGPDGKMVAENNDFSLRYNFDSRLYVILPSSGKYCVRVAECWKWAQLAGKNPSQICSGDADKMYPHYALYGFSPDPTTSGYVADEEKGNDVASATSLEYEPDGQGDYYYTLAWGTWSDANDVDVFRVHLPADIGVPQGRAKGYFYFQPSGPGENGSTSPPGVATLVDPSDVTMKPLALIDPSKNLELNPPLTVDKDYFLLMPHAQGAAGANDFYFFLHHGHGSNPTEAETVPGANDSVITAETLAPNDNGNGTVSHYVEGDIGVGDVDYFHAVVPMGLAKQTAGGVCGAQRNGSGLRNLKVTIVAADGTDLPNATATETETTTPYAKGTLPNGATDVYMRIEATQDMNVTGTWYRCGFHLGY